MFAYLIKIRRDCPVKIKTKIENVRILAKIIIF